MKFRCGTLIKDEEEKKRILHACHVDPTARHLTKAIYKIKEGFRHFTIFKNLARNREISATADHYFSEEGLVAN